MQAEASKSAKDLYVSLNFKASNRAILLACQKGQEFDLLAVSLTRETPLVSIT